MPDGARLAARVWLPADAERHPVPAIVEYIPYRKRDGTAWRDGIMQPYVAGHGYAVLRIDLRGTGESDGLLRDEYTRQEHDDGVGRARLDRGAALVHRPHRHDRRILGRLQRAADRGPPAAGSWRPSSRSAPPTTATPTTPTTWAAAC